MEGALGAGSSPHLPVSAHPALRASLPRWTAHGLLVVPVLGLALSQPGGGWTRRLPNVRKRLPGRRLCEGSGGGAVPGKGTASGGGRSEGRSPAITRPGMVRLNRKPRAGSQLRARGRGGVRPDNSTAAGGPATARRAAAAPLLSVLHGAGSIPRAMGAVGERPAAASSVPAGRAQVPPREVPEQEADPSLQFALKSARLVVPQPPIRMRRGGTSSA